MPEMPLLCCNGSNCRDDLNKGGWRWHARRYCQHFIAGLGDEYCMLPLRGKTTILGFNGPAIAHFTDLATAGINHRLHSENHTGSQFFQAAGAAVVQYLRLLLGNLAH